MSYLQYYRDEQERHPEMHAAKLTPEEAVLAIKKLARHFKTGPLRVKFTSGNRVSHAGGTRITLNADYLNWLLVAHEFAHIMEDNDRRKKLAKLVMRFQPGSEDHAKAQRIQARRHHGKHHARMTDRAVAYIEKKGWVAGAIKERLDEKQARAEERERRAAQPPPIDARITKREEQIKRLSTRIKTLETRRKKAQRSLRALQRSKQKVVPPHVQRPERRRQDVPRRKRVHQQDWRRRLGSGREAGGKKGEHREASRSRSRSARSTDAAPLDSGGAGKAGLAAPPSSREGPLFHFADKTFADWARNVMRGAGTAGKLRLLGAIRKAVR